MLSLGLIMVLNLIYHYSIGYCIIVTFCGCNVGLDVLGLSLLVITLRRWCNDDHLLLFFILAALLTNAAVMHFVKII